MARGATLDLRLPDGTPVPAGVASGRDRDRHRRARSSEAVFALELPDDALAWVRLSATPVDGGAEVRLIDLSGDHALVAALERARRLESVLHQIDDYVYVWEYHPDGSSRPIAESIPSRRFFRLDPRDGVSDEDLWRQRVHPDDRHLYDAVTTPRRRAAAAPASIASRTRTARSCTSSTAGTAHAARWRRRRRGRDLRRDHDACRRGRRPCVGGAVPRAGRGGAGGHLHRRRGRLRRVRERSLAADLRPHRRQAFDNSWADAVHPEDRAIALELVARGGAIRRARTRRRSGSAGRTATRRGSPAAARRCTTSTAR